MTRWNTEELAQAYDEAYDLWEGDFFLIAHSLFLQDVDREQILEIIPDKDLAEKGMIYAKDHERAVNEVTEAVAAAVHGVLAETEVRLATEGHDQKYIDRLMKDLRAHLENEHLL